MINSLWIFILHMNNKRTKDGQYVLAGLEIVAYIIICGIIRNT